MACLSSRPSQDPLRLIAAAGTFGAAALPLYALALATANDQVPDHKRVATSSTLVLLYGLDRSAVRSSRPVSWS